MDYFGCTIGRELSRRWIGNFPTTIPLLSNGNWKLCKRGGEAGNLIEKISEGGFEKINLGIIRMIRWQVKMDLESN